jgi:hypothetical protein
MLPRRAGAADDLAGADLLRAAAHEVDGDGECDGQEEAGFLGRERAVRCESTGLVRSECSAEFPPRRGVERPSAGFRGSGAASRVARIPRTGAAPALTGLGGAGREPRGVG